MTTKTKERREKLCCNHWVIYKEGTKRLRTLQACLLKDWATLVVKYLAQYEEENKIAWTVKGAECTEKAEVAAVGPIT